MALVSNRYLNALFENYLPQCLNLRCIKPFEHSLAFETEKIQGFKYSTVKNDSKTMYKGRKQNFSIINITIDPLSKTFYDIHIFFTHSTYNS